MVVAVFVDVVEWMKVKMWRGLLLLLRVGEEVEGNGRCYWMSTFLLRTTIIQTGSRERAHAWCPCVRSLLLLLLLGKEAEETTTMRWWKSKWKMARGKNVVVVKLLHYWGY
jgi:hypothetical protein